MCLYLKENKKPFIANEDIVCYKVVFKGANQYRSPYTCTLYKLNTIMNDSVRITKQKTQYYNGETTWSISAGGFHVYPTLNEAKTHIFKEYEILKEKGKAELYNFTILKCIIPKDTKYYIGTFSGMKSYCSKSLKIIDEDNE